jgi:peptidoglycan/LPS O-acetylase OafA/YrhL
VKPALATFGVHGNALFFFISGFTLAISGSAKKLSFCNWYKRRLGRIWPCLIVWSALCNMMTDSPITWQGMFLGYGFWFLQFILIAYIVMYFVLRYWINSLKPILVISVVGTAITIALLPKTSQSIYHEFHFFCYISCLILGSYCAVNKKEKVTMGTVKCLFSFVLYFIIMSLGKGKDGWIYYTQIIALLPLLSFIFYAYYASMSVMLRLYSRKNICRTIYCIGSLCLEIYVVQYVIISDRWNTLFPLNIPITFCLIVLLAYILRILINFFFQTLNNEPYDWKKIMKV